MTAVRFDPSDTALALGSLLAQNPNARIVALSDEGLPTEMPASFDPGEHIVLDGISTLNLVVAEDLKAVIDAWNLMLESGSAGVKIHLAADPEALATVYNFDVRPGHGVCMSVLVTTRSIPDDLLQSASPPAQPPRLAKLQKDERSTVLQIDEATTLMLGWTAAEMIGRRSLDFIHPEDHEIALGNWMAMLGTPGMDYGVQLRHRHKNGSWVWVWILNHNRLREPDGCVTAELIDISQEMAAQEALRAREHLLDRLAEALPVGLFQIDVNQRVSYCNDRLTQILGHDPRTVMAPIVNVVDDDRASLDSAIEVVLKDGADRDLEVRFHRSGQDDLRIGAIALRALTDDADVVTGAIATLADVTDSASMRFELERRATYDELTGCHNRASILAELNTALRNQAANSGTAVVFLDLDRFKPVNDELGHATGDELLAAVANRLRAQTRTGDTVGRIGGDEFLIVCTHVGSGEEALRIAERTTAAVSGTIAVAGCQIEQQLSVGVAWSGLPVDADTLIAEADKAMYQSKRVDAGQPVYSPVRSGAS
jgi:diguanylate cyclase (GGDEF)-like protein/PAS domain S-box-containing protein